MSGTRDQQAVRAWPVEVVTVPPHPRRPAGPYCPTCGTTPPLHLFSCSGPETEEDPVTYTLPDAEGEALEPFDPTECTCYEPDPDDVGECRTCRRLVIGGEP